MEHGIVAGSYVKLHPCTDEWMQGIRYADVTSIGPNWVHLCSQMYRHKFKMPAAHLGINIILANRDWPDSHAEPAVKERT